MRFVLAGVLVAVAAGSFGLGVHVEGRAARRRPSFHDMRVNRVPDLMALVDPGDPAVRALAERLGLDARVRDGSVAVEREAGHALVPRIVEIFPPGRLRAVSLRRPTLADAYLAATGDALDEEVRP